MDMGKIGLVLKAFAAVNERGFKVEDVAVGVFDDGVVRVSVEANKLTVDLQKCRPLIFREAFFEQEGDGR